MTPKEAIDLLEKERYKRGMTILEFSAEIDISMSTYAHWIYHDQRPKAGMLFYTLENAGFEIIIRRKDDGAVDI